MDILKATSQHKIVFSYPKFPQIDDRKASDSGTKLFVGFADDGTLILNTTASNFNYPPTILSIEEDDCVAGSDTTGCISSAKASSISVRLTLAQISYYVSI